MSWLPAAMPRAAASAGRGWPPGTTRHSVPGIIWTAITASAMFGPAAGYVLVFYAAREVRAVFFAPG